MNIYLDINDALLTHNLKPAEGLRTFLEFILKGNDVYWLTTHCKGDSAVTINYLRDLLPTDILDLVKQIKPTNWNTRKTEAIDFSKEFLWFDDYLFEAEKSDLQKNNKLESWIKIDLRGQPSTLTNWVKDNGVNKIEVYGGDIAKLEIIGKDKKIAALKVDCIVNATNEFLYVGGGVCGAIHEAAGPELEVECRKIGLCRVGQAVISKAYKIPVKNIIHTVARVWQGGGYEEEEKLASCYRSCLELAVKHGLKTIAFPSISTGSFGFPITKASRIAIKTVHDALLTYPEIKKVYFILFDFDTYNYYSGALAELKNK